MNKLKDLRQQNNKSAEVLSNLLNISVQAYYKYEKGINEPNLDNLIKLADFYHVTIDELVGRPTSLINKSILTERERSIVEQVLTMNDEEQKLVELFIKTCNKRN